MKINTRIFGEIEISEDKILTFENGILGFPELKSFTLIHDEEQGTNVGIRFMQSLDEPGFAIPVMDPHVVMKSYAPMVNDELLAGLGELNEDNTLILVSVTIPSDLTRMTANLQGPFVINVDERKASQIIVEGDEYPVKYPIYEILRLGKEGE